MLPDLPREGGDRGLAAGAGDGRDDGWLARMELRRGERQRPADIGDLDHGDAVIGIEIPRGFAADVAGGRPAVVQLLVDGTSSNTATVAQGYATLGRIGFEGRFDYAAIGSVTNLAARLCGEAAPWQILVTQRVHAAAEKIVVSESVGELALRGFLKPVHAYNIRGLNAAVAS